MSNEPIKYCCDVFPKIMKDFKWFSFIDDDGKTYLLMPCIVGDNDYRVNNCPSCGEVVRSIRILEEQYINDSDQ